MELCAFQSEEKIFSPYKCGVYTKSPSIVSGWSWHLLSSIVWPATENARSDVLLAAGTPRGDLATQLSLGHRCDLCCQ